MKVAVLVVTALVVLCSGCASVRTSRETPDTSGMAAPPPDLVGTWSGTVFAVPGSLYLISTPVELTVKPDGTWTWSKRGQEQARGRVVKHGTHVVFEEDRAKEGAQRIELEQRGTQLWGVSRAFIPGAPSAVQLQKVQS